MRRLPFCPRVSRDRLLPFCPFALCPFALCLSPPVFRKIAVCPFAPVFREIAVYPFAPVFRQIAFCPFALCPFAFCPLPFALSTRDGGGRAPRQKMRAQKRKNESLCEGVGWAIKPSSHQSIKSSHPPSPLDTRPAPTDNWQSTPTTSNNNAARFVREIAPIQISLKSLFKLCLQIPFIQVAFRFK